MGLSSLWVRLPGPLCVFRLIPSTLSSTLLSAHSPPSVGAFASCLLRRLRQHIYFWRLSPSPVGAYAGFCGRIRRLVWAHSPILSEVFDPALYDLLYWVPLYLVPYGWACQACGYLAFEAFDCFVASGLSLSLPLECAWQDSGTNDDLTLRKGRMHCGYIFIVTPVFITLVNIHLYY
jgi:hypothetical protein